MPSSRALCGSVYRPQTLTVLIGCGAPTSHNLIFIDMHQPVIDARSDSTQLASERVEPPLEGVKPYLSRLLAAAHTECERNHLRSLLVPPPKTIEIATMAMRLTCPWIFGPSIN